MDVHTGAVPGDEAVPHGSMKGWMEVTLMKGHLRVCPDRISDGQEDGPNRGGLLYSE